jgi:transposase-like protein
VAPPSRYPRAVADPDGGLTIAEAARELGTSIHAVRWRIRAGELAAERVATRHGPAWRVSLAPPSRDGHATPA